GGDPGGDPVHRSWSLREGWRRLSRGRVLLAGAGSGFLLATIAVVTAPASAASAGCSMAYSVQSQWPGGFTGSVVITNLGSALTGWSLAFDFPDAGQKVTQGWNATWSQSGRHVT